MCKACQKPYLIRAHWDAQEEIAFRFHKAADPPHIPNVAPWVDRISIPAQTVMLVAGVGHRKIVLWKAATQPMAGQFSRCERIVIRMRGNNLIVLHCSELLGT